MAALTVDQILSGGSLGLTSGFSDLFVFETGGRRILYALNRSENRLLEIEIASNGDLSLANSLTLGGTFAAGSDPQVTIASFASGGTALALSGLPPSDGQQVTLSGTGALGTQQTLAGVSMLEAPIGFEAGGTPVLVGGTSTGGLTHYADAGAGYTATMALSDASDRYLADVAASAVFVSQGNTYVATVSEMENGLNIASVDDSGLTQAGALGNAEGLPITAPSDVAPVTRLAETLVFVSAFGTSSLSVVQVDGGLPRLADHVIDAEDTRFQGVSSLAAVTHGDFAYVAVGGAEGGVSLLTALPGGRLVHLDSVVEDETVPLDQIEVLEAQVIGDTLHLFAGSANEAGLTRLQYDLSGQGSVVIATTNGSGSTGTALDDQLIGSVVGEPLNGFAGDDILLDGAGNDMLTGGPGADLFVFTADGVWDQITDFERGVDRLDLSAFDFLYDVSQFSVTPTGTGATLSFGSEIIYLTTSDAAPLSAAELSNADILNVDRPPFLLIGREIVGTSANETLNGGAGNDTIAGAGGDDSLSGNFGLDILLGGTGHDTLNGGSDRDTLIGSTGDDLLFGGDGDDVLYGDDWS